jgi:hypothetical protein
MTLAEKIAAERAALIADKDAQTVLTTKDDTDDSDLAQIEELTLRIESRTKTLGTLENAERSLAASARPADGMQSTALLVRSADGTFAPQAAANRNSPAIITQRSRSQPNGFDLLVRSALVAYESHKTHESHEAIIQRRYGGALDVTEVTRLLCNGAVIKAAQNPAMTNVAGWAAELVREGYAAFMDALAPESVVPRIPMTRYEFDGFGKLSIPSRATRYPDNPNLAGAFRAEGAPIRVGRTTVGAKYLTPKSMGVIGTFTKELLKRSTPNIEAAIRQWMLEDTAIELDVIVLDAVAGDAIRPAGLRNGIAAGDTRASVGNTSDDINTDVLNLITGLANHNLGRRPVFIMNTARAFAVSFSKTPTGTSAFPGMNDASGSIAGIPVVSSTTVPSDVVLLVDAAELAFAGGAPEFEGTDVATLHEDDGAPNANGVTGASVLPINAAAAATPVRSLFQTHSAALKATWEIDWTVVRPGAVQELTAVGWGTPVTP